MSLYNILFGKNSQTDLLLAVLGLRQHDVERFRDVDCAGDGSTISIYTRTGGGNRDDYPNLTMRKLPEWRGSADDDFDSTYCTDEFAVPEPWRADVVELSDPLTNGLRSEFGRHLAKTLSREPTDADKAQAEYDRERAALAKTRHFMANGHTFVPMDDAAMKTALECAEANGGKLRSCWGIAPLSLVVCRDFRPYPNAPNPESYAHLVRVEVNYDYSWTMDLVYWKHCQERFVVKYPLTMSVIAEVIAKAKGR